MKKTVLCYLFRDDEVLLIYKKRGQGKDLWNAPGGKVDPGESDMDAAIRECHEETGLRPRSLLKLGTLEFFFTENTGHNWDNLSSVYVSSDFEGSILTETDETIPKWFNLGDVPFDKMWDDDREWFPNLLTKKHFHIKYWFDSSGKVVKTEHVV